jgi:hypothetical protein
MGSVKRATYLGSVKRAIYVGPVLTLAPQVAD